MRRQSQYYSTATRSPFIYKNGQLFAVDDFGECDRNAGSVVFPPTINGSARNVCDMSNSNDRDEDAIESFFEGFDWGRRRAGSTSSTVSSGSTMTLTPRDTFCELKGFGPETPRGERRATLDEGVRQHKRSATTPMSSSQAAVGTMERVQRASSVPTTATDVLAKDNYLGLIVSSNREVQRAISEASASPASRKSSLSNEPSLKNHRTVKRKPVPLALLTEAQSAADDPVKITTESVAATTAFESAPTSPKSVRTYSSTTASPAYTKKSELCKEVPVKPTVHTIAKPAVTSADKKANGKTRSWVKSITLRRQRSEQVVSSPRQIVRGLPTSPSSPIGHTLRSSAEDATPKATWTRTIDPDYVSEISNKSLVKAVSCAPLRRESEEVGSHDTVLHDRTTSFCDSPQSDDHDDLFSPSLRQHQLGDSSSSSDGSSSSPTSSRKSSWTAHEEDNQPSPSSFSTDLYKALPPLPPHFGLVRSEGDDLQWPSSGGNEELEGSAFQHHERRAALKEPNAGNTTPPPQKTSNFYGPLFAALAMDVERQTTNDGPIFAPTMQHAANASTLSSSPQSFWIDAL